jgi:hypothetical protein
MAPLPTLTAKCGLPVVFLVFRVIVMGQFVVGPLYSARSIPTGRPVHPAHCVDEPEKIPVAG